MKKIIIIISCCILAIGAILLFYSCSKSKDQFEPVLSVTFTSNGNEQTFTSHIQVEYSSATIDAEEYNNAPTDRKHNGAISMNSLSKIKIYDHLKTAKNSTYITIFEDELDGNHYCTFFDIYLNKTRYVKYTYVKTACHYVYVNVKNDNTLVIRSGRNNSETTYTVTSFKITEF